MCCVYACAPQIKAPGELAPVRIRADACALPARPYSDQWKVKAGLAMGEVAMRSREQAKRACCQAIDSGPDHSSTANVRGCAAPSCCLDHNLLVSRLLCALTLANSCAFCSR